MVQESTYEDVAGQAIMGQSLEGTDMKVIQICRGGDCNNGKPDMYIEGGIHARQVLNGYCQGRSLLAIVLCLSPLVVHLKYLSPLACLRHADRVAKQD